MKKLSVALAAALALTVASPALAATKPPAKPAAKPATKPAAKPAPSNPMVQEMAKPRPLAGYQKLDEEKFLGFGTGKYSFGGQPVSLLEKPWWYGWTPDTTFNSGVSTDKFKQILALSGNPDALAEANSRDGVRSIGMMANIGSRVAGLVIGVPLIFTQKDPRVGVLAAFGLIGSGIIVDWTTEVLTLGKFERAISLHNQAGTQALSPLNSYSAAAPVVDYQVTLFQTSF